MSFARRRCYAALVLMTLLTGAVSGAGAAETPEGDPGGLIRIDSSRYLVTTSQRVVARVRYEIPPGARLRVAIDKGDLWRPKVRKDKIRLRIRGLRAGRHVLRAVIVDASGKRLAHGRAAFVVMRTRARGGSKPIPTPPPAKQKPAPPGKNPPSPVLGGKPVLGPDVSPPSTPAGLAVVGTGRTTAQVSWNASIDNVGVVGYRVTRAGAPDVVVTGTSTSIGGLACGTPLSVSVVALDASGNASNAASAAGSTAACASPPDTLAPSTPGGVTVTGSGATSVQVSWNASSDNVGVVGYRITRSGAPPVVVTGTSTSIGGLPCATSVTVSVTALDAAGNASGPGQDSGSTGACTPPPPPPPDGVPPSTPGSLAVTGTGQTSVEVTWSASSDNVGVTAYRVTRSGAAPFNVTGTSTAIGGLTCGTTVTVTVEALDAVGNASLPATAQGATAPCPDTTPPTAPPNLSVVGTGQTSVQVSWGASGDNVGVVGYRLTRSGAAPLDVTGTSTAIGGLACGTAVTVSVVALDAAGNTSPASTASGATSACPPPVDTTPPTPPGNLTVVAAGQTAVQVSWNASTDNVGVVGYTVTRSGSAPVDVAGTSLQIAGLACGTTVSVSVVARDAAGNVSTAAAASGSTSACGPPPGPADRYVSPAGNDSNACTQAAPCATFGRAYRAASAGQIVSVAPGSYGRQTIPVDSTKTSSSDVVFVGNGASTGELVVQGNHVTLSNLQSGGWEAASGSNDVTFLNVNVSGGGAVFVTSATNVAVIGGIIDGAGGYVRNGSQVKPASSSSPQPQNVLFDGVTIRNYRKDPSSSDHVDCLHFMSGTGMTIRNSSFSNCEHFDILFTKFLGPTPSNVLIENNFFRCCGAGFYSVQLGGDHGESFVNFMIRNNSADKGLTVGGNGSNTLSNVAFYNNNVPGIGGCDRTGVTANYNNLFSQGSKCGANDQLAASGFVSSTDMHLAAGAPSIDKAFPAQAPATDIDGEARPKGAGPDIGADER